jgi:hypothetical protein
MQIKAMLRLHPTPVRMVTMKNTMANVGKKEHFHTVGGNIN